MLSRLKKYQESGPIKDARVVVVLRTGNIGFSNVAPCLFIGKDVGLCYGKRSGTMFISSSLSNTFQVVENENNCNDYLNLRKKDETNYESNFILLTAIYIAN